MNSQMLSSSMQRCAAVPRATVRTGACPLLRPVAQMRGLAQHPHARAFTSYAQTKLHAQLTSRKPTSTIFILQYATTILWLYHLSLALDNHLYKGLCLSLDTAHIDANCCTYTQSSSVALYQRAGRKSDAVLCGAGSSRRGAHVVAAKSQAGAWQSVAHCMKHASHSKVSFQRTTHTASDQVALQDIMGPQSPTCMYTCTYIFSFC